MWSFENEPTSELAKNFEISYTVPSSCARALRDGTADIGIIPAITYATIPDLLIIPDVAIAARGPVRSILLVSKTPIEKIRTIATDSSSRTSVVLTRVLMENWFGGPREMQEMDPDLQSMLAACDSALLIGDAALLANTSGYYVYDLAELWRQKTGKAFVFALWAVRRAALDEKAEDLDVTKVFQRSRDCGTLPKNIDVLAEKWGPRLGLSEESVREYLSDNIYYRLDPECLDGLRLFFNCAAEIGAIEAAPELTFL